MQVMSISCKMRWLVLFLATTAVLAQHSSYEGYKVYRVIPSTEDQLKSLIPFTKDGRFDFWSSLRSVGKPVDIMVEPSAQSNFLLILKAIGVSYVTLIENFENVVQQERLAQWSADQVPEGRISFAKYNRHSEINAYLDQISADYSNIASVETIGKSSEGRDLKVIKISSNPSANKPIIFIDGGIHAREWVAPALATYIINQLVENSNNAGLLDNVDWHILPVVNPDGYEHSHRRVRMWKKTRSLGRFCYGTDANRNFDFHWGEVGEEGSSFECSDVYKGRSAFSEVETQAVRDYILKHKDNIKMYVTIHSYGGYILFPWGFTSALPDDYDELQGLGEAASLAIEKVNGTKYTVGTFNNVLYPAAGRSDDWAKGVAGVELSYTLELRGEGWNAFDPVPSQILPIVAEAWEGFKVFHKHVESKFG